MKFTVNSLVLAMTSSIVVVAQQNTPQLLDMPIQTCDSSGCVTEATKVTLDANWRWYYHPDNFQNCFDNGYTCTNDADCADCVVHFFSYMLIAFRTCFDVFISIFFHLFFGCIYLCD
jgi:hypothetical protein